MTDPKQNQRPPVRRGGSANNPRSSEPALRAAEGAKRRPGAPPGNLNALKTGLHSKQFAAIGRQLAADPKTRDVLLDLSRRYELRLRRASDVNALLLTLFVERARKIAGGDLNWEVPVDDFNSMLKAAARLSGTAFEDLPASNNSPKNNAYSRTNGENQTLP